MKKKTKKKKTGMAKKITDEVKKATKGPGILKMIFKKNEGIYALIYFLTMICADEVRISDLQHALLDSARRKQMWGCVENRTVVFGIGDKFKIDWFILKMANAIEEIEALP